MSNTSGNESVQGTLFEIGSLVEPLPADESLSEIKADVVARRCAICRPGDPIIFGGPNPNARLMLIGESPTLVDEPSGQPFSGPSGELLDRIIAAIGRRREDCYLCNVVKCCVSNPDGISIDGFESCGQ